MTETEAFECGLGSFYEKCMTLIDKMEHIGLCKEEFLILKVILGFKTSEPILRILKNENIF